MRVIRGRGQTPNQDKQHTQRLIELVRDTTTPALRVWQPNRVVAFGRRDQHRDGYEQAVNHAHTREYEPVERSVGGHAVAFTGNTVAFALVTPTDDLRSGIQQRYTKAAETLVSALSQLGIDLTEGEPDGAFCPGTHSLSAQGKIAGLAQRVHRDVAIVSGVVIVCDHEEIAAVLDPVYDALEIPFDPGSVGSVARAGGPATPQLVCEAIEAGFAPNPVQHISVEEIDGETLNHSDDDSATQR